jgi:hypothetical protein
MSLNPFAGQFKLGTEKHRKISSWLDDRVNLAHDAYDSRFSDMLKMEKQFNAYVPTKDVDRERKRKKSEEGEHDYVTIEIPYSYATLMTAHTYYTSVFMGRNPTFQMAGRHGEGEQQTQCVEALLDYQFTTGGGMVPLFVWLLDPGRFGYGVIGHFWDTERITTRQYVEEVPTFLGLPIPGAKPRRVPQLTQSVGYQGNRLFNVRPQDFLPDPRKALIDFQKGEFCARYVEISWHELSAGERSGKYFNVAALKAAHEATLQGNIGTVTRDRGAEDLVAHLQLPDNAFDGISSYEIPSGLVKGHEIYVRLVPSEWGLGEGDDYEVWVFSRSQTGIVFGVEPLGLIHGKFPFDILLNETEGYSLFSASMMDRVSPLNDALSWLLNSHMYNVRAMLNNQLVVDPSRVVMKDVESKEAGKIIRLKPAAYGQDARSVISQLQVGDITRSHLNDMQMFEQIIQRVLGVNDNVMGMVNTGGRKTATEVRSSTSFSVNRLKTTCEWFSATGFAPLAQKLVQSSQQLYDMGRKMKIVGDLGQMAPQFAMVTSDSIAGFYDYVPVDGTLPVDRFAQANLWQMLMGQARNFPQIMQGVDMVKLFGWVANLAGLKNFNQFKLQVVPDAMAMGQAQAGNVVPLRGGPPQLTEPGQVPMMGQTT